MDKKKCIIMISATNYLKKSAGTEKFTRGLADICQKQDIDIVQVFPVSTFNNKLQSRLKKDIYYVGINYNGDFLGCYKQEKLNPALGYICHKYGVEYTGIIVNQLLDYNLPVLVRTLKQLKLSIKVIVHDFSYICPYLQRKAGRGLECYKELHLPDEISCGSCCFAADALKDREGLNAFFNVLNEQIEDIICPSQDTADAMGSLMPDIGEKLRVRPHLSYIEKPYREVIKDNGAKTDKLRIAFLGAANKAKGFDAWKKLHKEIPASYKYYYFGKTPDEFSLSNDEIVNVDFQDPKAPSMPAALRDNKIDIAFIWSECRETYSYTLYEALEAGCFIITNDHSGNIKAVAGDGISGRVFASLQDSIDYMENPDKVRQDIDKYREEGMLPVDVDFNNDISLFEMHGKPQTLSYGKNCRNAMVTQLYKAYI